MKVVLLLAVLVLSGCDGRPEAPLVELARGMATEYCLCRGRGVHSFEVSERQVEVVCQGGYGAVMYLNTVFICVGGKQNEAK